MYFLSFCISSYFDTLKKYTCGVFIEYFTHRIHPSIRPNCSHCARQYAHVLFIDHVLWISCFLHNALGDCVCSVQCYNMVFLPLPYLYWNNYVTGFLKHGECEYWRARNNNHCLKSSSPGQVVFTISGAATLQTLIDCNYWSLYGMFRAIHTRNRRSIEREDSG